MAFTLPPLLEKSKGCIVKNYSCDTIDHISIEVANTTELEEESREANRTSRDCPLQQ
jgi:hypothetical protein